MIRWKESDNKDYEKIKRYYNDPAAIFHYSGNGCKIILRMSEMIDKLQAMVREERKKNKELNKKLEKIESERWLGQ